MRDTIYYKIKRDGISLRDRFYAACKGLIDEDAIYIFHPFKLAVGEIPMIDIGDYRLLGLQEYDEANIRWCAGLPHRTNGLIITEPTQLEKLMCIGGKTKTIKMTSELDAIPSEKT